MMTIRFPAVLEDEDGNVIEYGTAELAPEPNSLNFKGGFIPLYRIGEKVKVVRMWKENRLDELRGEVFLSSPNLLRVTGIDESSMENIYRIFYSNVRFKAFPYIPAPNRKFQRNKKIEYQAEATVYFLSATKMKFLSVDPLKAGQLLKLDLTEPFKIRDLGLIIRSVIDFGNIMNAYLCDIVELPAESGKVYSDFLASLAEDTGG